MRPSHLMQAMADALPHNAWHISLDGEVQWVNRCFRDYTGLPDEGLLGWSWTQIVHPDDLQRMTVKWRDAIKKTDAFQIEGRLRRHDGAFHWFFVSNQPFRDATGQIAGWFGSGIDVQLFKGSEAALRASHELLERITESADVVIMSIDHDLRLTQFNNAYRLAVEQHYGRCPTIGMSLLQASAALDDVRRAETLLRRALSGETVEILEQFGLATHRRGIFESRYFPIRNASQSIIGAAGIFKDVTERQRQLRAEMFLHAVDEELRALIDAAALQARAARLLCEHLGAARCAYANVDPDEDGFEIEADFSPELPSARGRYRMSAFGRHALDHMRTGKVWVVDDAQVDSRLSEPDRPSYRELTMPAVMCAPLHRGGRFVACMAVHDSQPRHWHPHEIELLEVVANRCWESIERIKAEAVARASQARFHALVTGSSQILWTANAQGLTVEDSPSWRDFTGQTYDEFHGMGWADAIHPHDMANVATKMRQALAAGRGFEIEFRLRRADGSWCWMAEQIRPVRDQAGQITEWVGLGVDISERKRGERRDAFLVRLEDSIRPLLDPQAVAETALQLLCGNLMADRATHLDVSADQTRARVICDHAPGLPLLSGSYFMRDYGERIYRTLLDGKPYILTSRDDDTTLSDEERARFAAIDTAAEIMVPLLKGGRLLAMIGIFQKTPRQWTRDEIDLALNVATRCWESIERARANRELQDQDRRKDEFLAILAHELRNPLAPLRNAIDIGRLGSAGLPPEGLFDLMNRQVHQLIRLVDDLLDVSRITRGKLTLDRQHVSLTKVLNTAIETARPWIEASNHRLDLTIEADDVILYGDEVRLTQIFANLLNNAAKFSEPHGVISTLVSREGQHVFIRVRDQGIGIAPEMAERVFDVFAQVSRGTKQAVGGLGIGLSLVRSFVDLHGGTVTVHSDGLGMGSEFVVRLPVSFATSQTRPEPAFPQRIEFGEGGVLIVDDNHDSADSLAALLGTLGTRVLVAYSATDALIAIERHAPAVALLDLGMPEMDGYELARRIRLLREGRNIKLIALTGWGQEEDRRRSREAGFDHHFVKPVDLASLNAALRHSPGSRSLA